MKQTAEKLRGAIAHRVAALSTAIRLARRLRRRARSPSRLVQANPMISLHPGAGCVVDTVAAPRRRGDRRHSDQHRVLPGDEPGRDVLRKPSTGALASKAWRTQPRRRIHDPSAGRRRKRHAARRHERHRHVASEARNNMPVKPQAGGLFALWVSRGGGGDDGWVGAMRQSGAPFAIMRARAERVRGPRPK